MVSKPRYWLMKSEPSVYSLDDLKKDQKTSWEGVRNYQARNFMKDEMKKGDRILFYHSNAEPPGVAGLARVCREAYADITAWDKKSRYFDKKSNQQNPRWFMVDVEFLEKFPRFVPLAELQKNKKLQGMLVLKKGMRLSVQPVDRLHFNEVQKLGKLKNDHS